MSILRIFKAEILFVFFSIGFYFNLSAQFLPAVSGTSNNLLRASFVNENIIYVCGSAGTVLKSTNGGVGWSKLSTGTISDLYACYFHDKDNGFVAGNDGVILKTVDGGQSWQSVLVNNSVNFRGVYFKDLLNGYVLGSNMNTLQGVLYSTNDGGITWSEPSIHSQIQSINFSGDLGFLVGANGMIKRTTDGGDTWENITSNTSNMMVASQIVNNNLIFIVGGSTSGGSGTILRSTDGGKTFQHMVSNNTDYLSSVSFVDEFTGYVVGGQFPSNTSGKILKTTDGGTTWNLESSSDSRLYGVRCYNSSKCIVVGLDGVILMLSPNVTSVSDNNSNLDFNVHPNPFSDKINFELQKSGFVKVSLINSQGYEIFSDNLSISKEGKGEFNGGFLKPGIYFLKVTTDKGETIVNKVVKN